MRLSRILVDPLVADSVSDATGNAPDPATIEQPITTTIEQPITISATSPTDPAAAAASPAAAAVEQPPRRRDRLMSMRSRRRAMRWHYTSLAAAFATSAFVAGLLVAAYCLNSEALWAALA